MTASRRPIFRSTALEHYRQSRQKDMLPRFAAPPVLLLLWALLGLFLAGVVVAWQIRVPTYVTGTGMVVDSMTYYSREIGHQAVALLFFPTDPAHPLYLAPGMPVRMQIGSLGQPMHTTVTTVEPGVISPGQAQQRYGLGSTHLISEPSIAVLVKLPSTLPVQIYGGSLVSAQVQIGSHSILSLFAGPGSWRGV